ncbi:Pro-Pol polyprotein, partial [Mucuna pruriens]
MYLDADTDSVLEPYVVVFSYVELEPVKREAYFLRLCTKKRTEIDSVQANVDYMATFEPLLFGQTNLGSHSSPLFIHVRFEEDGIDFMGPFPISNGYSYILLVVDYISRWVEARATRTNDAKAIVDFLKSNIFYRFSVPRALISDQGTHFCNRAMSSLLEKYGVVHKIATPYHPQANEQAEVFNREIKKILQKVVNPNRKDWSRLLDDALWVHRIAYRTSLELEELHLEAYENSRIYKKKVKQFHDNWILRKEFKVGQKVEVSIHPKQESEPDFQPASTGSAICFENLKTGSNKL